MPTEIRSLRVEGVVLRHSDWGEADRLLLLYTRERGKLRALAKGVRKLRSRKAGHLEPFTRVALMLARGRDMWIVTQAETVEAYQPLRENLLKLGQAAYVLELVDRFGYEEGEDAGLYQLLTATLRRISEEEDAFLAVRYFEMRVLDLFGFRPQLFECVRCAAEIKPQDQFFSALQGGVLCPKCGPQDPTARPASIEALRFLRHIQRSNYPETKRARIPASIRNEMEILLQYYLTYHLERKLNSPEFLRTIRLSEKK